MNLTIDIGNTSCKVIIFQNEIPVFQDICKVLSPRYLQRIYKQYEIEAAMFSSVVSMPLTLKESFKKYGIKEFNSKTLIPIKNLYTSVEDI